MRPVVKPQPGAVVQLRDGSTDVVATTYNDYKDSKPLLEGALGDFCSYCEDAFNQARDLHVEHVQPKGLPQYAHLETQWSNFLLSCQTCNGRDNKDTKNVVLADYHLPHLNNTYMSLTYMAGGVVEANKKLTGLSYQHAEALLKLVGLEKSPATSRPGDKRWLKRREDWDLAKKYHAKYQSGKADEDTIVDLVAKGGGWSIWFTVFKGEDAVLQRLISDIKGTCAACFDPQNHYEPIERNPQNNTDPV